MRSYLFNIRALIIIGSIFSFVSLTYTVMNYLDMRGIERLVVNQHYGNDVVFEKLKKISDPSSLSKLFITELRTRGEQISLLKTSMVKTVARAKLILEIEMVMWLLLAIIFTIMLIRSPKNGA